MVEVSQKEVLDFCIQHRISFAIYKLPECKDNILIIADDVLEDIDNQILEKTKNGFVISPFSGEGFHKTLFLTVWCKVGAYISEEMFLLIKQRFTKETFSPEIKNYYAGFNSYEAQFEKLYKYISEGYIQKAILSRVKHIDGVSCNYAADLYYLLGYKYINAYTFMFYTPQSGLWSGASPELLLEIKGDKAQTVSLAGTRNAALDQEEWRNKEIDEQKIVTDYISGVLFNYKVSDLHISGPQTVKAGNVLHLKTFYNFDGGALKSRLWDFLKDIHPTPAVCGLPKDRAMEIVLKCEEHDRSYYAGYLGCIDEENISLFVNIRSLRFVGDGVDLYLGGGITIHSKAHEEWEETELKSLTLVDVLNELKELKINTI